jgi:hypothetical protein
MPQPLNHPLNFKKHLRYRYLWKRQELVQHVTLSPSLETTFGLATLVVRTFLAQSVRYVQYILVTTRAVRYIILHACL